MRCVLRASALVAGLVGVNSFARAGMNATWINAASGNWTTPSLWSTNPNYPNNDTPSGAKYDAVISATGSAYTPTISGNITVDSLILNSANATIKHTAGTLTAGNGLTLQAGTYALSGSGTIQNTTVNGSGGQFTASGGSLDGVTLNADLHLLNGASVTVLNSFTLNSTITFQGSLSSPTLLLSGLPTLTGTGAVVFDGFTNGTVKQTSGTLTIDSGLTFRTGAQGGTIGNSAYPLIVNGTITAQSSVAGLRLVGTTVTNNGSLSAPGGPLVADNLINNMPISETNGQLLLTGALVNNSTITATNGSISLGSGATAWRNDGTINAINASVGLLGPVTQAAVGTLNRTGGTIYMGGTLTGGLTLTAATGSWQVGGTISGGTVNASEGAQLVAQSSATFSGGVTLNTNVQIINSAVVWVQNGITVNGLVSLQPGSQVTALDFNGTQTLGGSGTIAFDGESDYGGVGVKNGTLTIGPNMTIRTGSQGGFLGSRPYALVNQGTVSAQTANKTLTVTGGTLTNSGTFQATNGVLEVDTGGNALTNLSAGKLTGGTWRVVSPGTLTFDGSTITTNAANVILDGVSSTFQEINGFTTNSGTFTVSGGRTFNTAANFTNTGTALATAGGTINFTAGTNSGTIDCGSGGFINFNGSFSQLPGAILKGNGTVTLASGGDKTLVSDGIGLDFQQGAKLNLNDNTMIVKSGSVGQWNGSKYDGVSGWIAAGRNGGGWSGSGIITSMSNAIGVAPLTTLAVAKAGDIGFGGTKTFAGQTVSPSDVLVMYTYAGDANLSGAIDGDDYFRIDNGFAAGLSGYENGDFNLDGTIDADDYFMIDRNYVSQGTAFSRAGALSGVAFVPEPGGILLGITIAWFIGRRRNLNGNSQTC